VRYREGFDKKVLMLPNGVYKIVLPNMVTGVHLPTGHRIGIQISSSDFPTFERNLNTGGNNYDETRGVVAENSVHFGGRYASYVLLPLLPDLDESKSDEQQHAKANSPPVLRH
jgi:predicted acyl esterase